MFPPDTITVVDQMDRTTDGVLLVIRRGTVEVEIRRQGQTYFLHASEYKNGHCSYTIGQRQAPHVKGAMLMAKALLMH